MTLKHLINPCKHDNYQLPRDKEKRLRVPRNIRYTKYEDVRVFIRRLTWTRDGNVTSPRFSIVNIFEAPSVIIKDASWASTSNSTAVSQKMRFLRHWENERWKDNESRSYNIVVKLKCYTKLQEYGNIKVLVDTMNFEKSVMP